MSSKLVPPLNMGMLLLALFPILYYYASPFFYSWGEVLLLLFVGYRFMTKGKPAFKYPQYYLLYWFYCAVSLIVLSNTFKITYLIPGGISTFIWSLMLGTLLPRGDVNTLLKYFRLIFIPIAILFVVQELSFKATGSRFCFYLPISSQTAYYGGLSFEQLKTLYTFGERSASIFMEPAYFASFLLIHLCLELFSDEFLDNLYTPWAVLISIILLLLKSGTGLVGLALLVSIKLISYSKRVHSGKFVALITVFIPLVCVGAIYYFSTEIGESMMRRSSELTDQSGSSYERIFRGLEIFSRMPLLNMLVGIDVSIFSLSNMYNGVDVSTEGMLFNGFMTVLVSKGIIGMFLLLIVYFLIYKNSSILTKSSLILLLLMSWIESVYFSPIMLILTIVAYTDKIRCRRNILNII